jgi:hypothetical protein
VTLLTFNQSATSLALSKSSNAILSLSYFNPVLFIFIQLITFYVIFSPSVNSHKDIHEDFGLSVVETPFSFGKKGCQKEDEPALCVPVECKGVSGRS